ncbi:hypothetical protein [Fictibacillus phosphorivorans]|uniref:hypothetical protein n=1 Tax=Fictibacillus phosphorivorans TaxID=1221500 RepID=UPI000AB1319E|nr:hypothetical protein [Fictibacillus phosphorivorans]
MERKLTPKEKRYLKKEEAKWDYLIEELQSGRLRFGGWPSKAGRHYVSPDAAAEAFTIFKNAILRIKKEEIINGK